MQLPAALVILETGRPLRVRRELWDFAATSSLLETGRPLRVRRELWDFAATSSYARCGGTVRHYWRACWRMGLLEILYCTVLYFSVGKAR